MLLMLMFPGTNTIHKIVVSFSNTYMCTIHNIVVSNTYIARYTTLLLATLTLHDTQHCC